MKHKKMSDILKEMALTVLKEPYAIPSSEAAHAALLLSHAAWNRSIGQIFHDKDCQPILQEFEKSRPGFWSELKTKDWKSLVDDLMNYKKQHFSHDKRIVVVCGMRDHNVHVEWKETKKERLID
ncbi:hypothetical protein [Desulfobacula sp.]|uniref:hypothetical protein n=1 Tax=Desulfobacula sp. TaxID=2593537 RepID=UPI002613B1F3|nr:hypothetical protein [Desulfobacula sp.]